MKKVEISKKAEEPKTPLYLKNIEVKMKRKLKLLAMKHGLTPSAYVNELMRKQ